METDLLVERPQPPSGPVTFEEFLEWGDEDTWAEWVDGQIIPMPVTVHERHDAIMGFLRSVLTVVAEHDDLGRVMGEPFVVRLPPPTGHGRAPDVFFVRRERLHLLRRTYFAGAPDLIVEILSEESQRRDRVEKLAEYERVGVPEYWMVDPDARWAGFHVLGPDRRYRLSLEGTSGVFQSAVLPRLRLPVEWLWQEPLPKQLDVARRLGLV